MNDTRPAVTEVEEWPARALWRNPPTGRSGGASKDHPAPIVAVVRSWLSTAAGFGSSHLTQARLNPVR